MLRPVIVKGICLDGDFLFLGGIVDCNHGLQMGAIDSAEVGCCNLASFGAMMTVQSGEF
jgi:hypothetical protein